MATAPLEPGIYVIKVHSTEHTVARNIAEDRSLLPKPVYALSEDGKPGGNVRNTFYAGGNVNLLSCMMSVEGREDQRGPLQIIGIWRPYRSLEPLSR